MAFDASVQAKAIDLIRLSIEMTTAADSGHPSSAASLAHLVTVLLYDHMRYDPKQPDAPAADRLVLSEGHSCPIIYAAAADLGIAVGKNQDRRRPMTRADALTLRAVDSPIDGHPNPAERFPFFPAATGSLGQGLSVAAGMALAARLDGIAKRIFCLIGDGESREGQIWEAVDFLKDYGLSAVCPIFNCNHFGQSAAVSGQQSADVTAAKLRAAGFTVRVIDGDDPSAIRAALREHAEVAAKPDGGPFAIVAQTVKGWGVPMMEGAGHHGKPIPAADVPDALHELEETARQVGAQWSEGDLRIPPVTAVAPPPRKPSGPPPKFSEALKRFGHEKALAGGKLAPRKAYGVALQALGHVRPDVVVLDGDVSNSTYSEYFHHDPKLAGRYFECRIAEQNMISCAGGLASAGKLPFASTFGKFVTRAYDQLEMALVSRFNLKVCGSHVGTGPSSDGPSQMALADVAFFRAYTTIRDRDGRPFLYLLNPADAYAAYALTLAMADHEGPCYLRTMRPDVPFLYDESTAFRLGGHEVLAEGNGPLLLATGYMVHEARKALDALKGQGVEATLVDLYSLPFDAEAIVRLARQNDRRVLTVEDNYGAGFGGAVADALAESGEAFTLRQLHVREIPKSARTPDDELRYLGLSAADIEKEALALAEVPAGGA